MAKVTDDVGDMPPGVRKVLMAYPIRNPIKWTLREGRAVLTYRKNFGRFEKWLHNKIGGPDDINRSLDDLGTEIWVMCNGSYNVAQIMEQVERRFGEDAEPVPERVRSFLELLLELGLIHLSPDPEPLKEPQIIKRTVRSRRVKYEGDRKAKKPVD